MSRYPLTHLAAGDTFGDLTIIQEIERVGTNRRYLCQCSCGAQKIAYMNNLRAGRTWSCGCKYVYGEAGRLATIAARHLRSQQSDVGRICHTCSEWKPWSEFSTNKKAANGKSSNCLDCARWNSIHSQYGISKEDWNHLLEQQSRACAVCLETDDRRRLCVDHDHSCCGKTKACKECIRGLLCDTCNRMVGIAEMKQRTSELFDFYLSKRPLSTRR